MVNNVFITNINKKLIFPNNPIKVDLDYFLQFLCVEFIIWYFHFIFFDIFNFQFINSAIELIAFYFLGDDAILFSNFFLSFFGVNELFYIPKKPQITLFDFAMDILKIS